MSEKSVGREGDVMSLEQKIDHDQNIVCLNSISAFRFSEKSLPYRDWGPSSKGERTQGIKPFTSKYDDKFQHHLCPFSLIV